MTHRHRAPGFIGSLPAGGLRSVMPGGNTIGGWCREERPRADGFRHVDTQRMIERLLEVGANHFFFGIWDSPTDFDDLCVEFAPAAERAGLLLTPYIVPPSETFEFGRASEPYRTDYLAWAEAMAELSLRCPAVTSWAIDDFDIGANGDTFTPEHLAAIRERAASINPDLALLTCAYFGSATSEAFLARYGPYVDGIILPFLDGPNSNTVVAESLADTIGQVLAATQDHGLGVLTLIYAGRFLDGVSSPTPTYVDDCLAGANDVTRREPGRHWGVVAYGLQTDGAPTPATEHRSLYGVGRGALACSPVIVRAGDWASLSCPVELDHTSQRYELSFWSNRQTQLGRVPVRGDLELSVELDGGPVWSGDVHDSTWMGVWVQGFDWQGPVNVTAAVDRSLAGHELTFRLVATRDFADRILDVGLDHIESIGLSVADPGFEDTTAWRSASSGGPLMAWLDHFTPDRPEETCTVVARRYLS